MTSFLSRTKPHHAKMELFVIYMEVMMRDAFQIHPP